MNQDCAFAELTALNVTYNKLARFPSITDWVLGFLQNLLGNVVSFQRIYDKVVAAAKADNTPEEFYQVGRIMQLLLDFAPLEKSGWSNDTGQASHFRNKF
jgi:hypothetical protein